MSFSLKRSPLEYHYNNAMIPPQVMSLSKKQRRQGAIFPGQATFMEAFPEVRMVQMVIREEGPGNHGLGLRRFNRSSFREFLNCSNAACSGCSGQALSLGDILRDLIRRRLPGIRLLRPCEGRLEKGGLCANVFEIEVDLTFEPAYASGIPPSCC
jgi:hypothetical protein